MYIKNVTISLLLTGLACFSSVYGNPIGPDEDLVVLSKETLDIGTLTWYGYLSEQQSSPSSPLRLHRRCGSNDVVCSGSHVPNASVCASLISSLRSNSGLSVSESPRSICLSQNGNQCCVSWNTVAPGLVQGNLVDAAQKTLDTCVNHGDSGLANNVDLAGSCVKQCLSDRATGC